MRFVLTTLLLITLMIQNCMPAFCRDKPLMVILTASWCSTCRKLKEVVQELEYEYNGKLEIVTLDVSNKETLETSRQLADSYSVDEAFYKRIDAVPKVGVFCPSGGNPEKIFIGETNIESYRKEIDKILLDDSKLCSL